VAKQVLSHIRSQIRQKSNLKKSVVPLAVKEPMLDPNPHLMIRYQMMAKSITTPPRDDGEYGKDDDDYSSFMHRDRIQPHMPPASPAPCISRKVVPSTPTSILPADDLTDSLLETFPLPEMSQTKPDTAPESEVVPGTAPEPEMVPGTALEQEVVPDTAPEPEVVPVIASDTDTQSPFLQLKRHRVGETTRGRGKRARKKT
jgi:hypothetical protein